MNTVKQFSKSLNQFTRLCETYQFLRIEPPLPILPETFEANIEANMISEGYTISAFQVYDYPNRVASMQMKYMNMEYLLVYNYAQNELYTVSSIQVIFDFLVSGNLDFLSKSVQTNLVVQVIA